MVSELSTGVIMRIVFWLFFVILPLVGINQTLVPRKITSSHGLQSNNSTCVFLDSRDILWIGTQQGLSIYEDGVITQVNLESGQPILNAWSIVEDYQNRIWVGTYGHGVFMFDGINWSSFGIENGLNSNQVRKLLPVKNKLWIGTSNSLESIMLDYLPGVETYTTELGIITDIVEIYDSTYFSNLEGKVFNAESLTELYKSDSKGLLGIHIKQDSVWLLHKEQLEVFAISEFTLGKQGVQIPTNTRIWDCVNVNDQLYGAGWGEYYSEGGLYNLTQKSVSNLRQQMGVPSNEIVSLEYDSKNSKLFAASKSNGIYELDLQNRIFKNSKREGDEFATKKLVSFNNYSVFLTQYGIDYEMEGKSYQIGQKDFKSYQNLRLKSWNRSFPKHENGFFELNLNLSAHEISFYDLDLNYTNSELWVSTNIGVFVLNQKLVFVDYIPVHSLVIDVSNKGHLIEAIPHNGVRLYNSNNEMEAKAYLKPNPKAPKSITDIETVGDNVFFASVFYGLTVYFDSQMVSLLETGAFTERNLRNLKKWGNEKLIISTDFGDVFIINSRSPFQVIDSIKADQLHGNNIQFLETYDSLLIVGMTDGINVVHNNRIAFYSNQNGLPDELIICGALVDNDLVVGTNNGNFSVNLSSFINESSKEYSLQLKELYVNGKEIENLGKEWFCVPVTELELPYNENSIRLKFMAKGFDYPGLLKYRFKLGEDEEWSGFNKNPEIELPFLDDGTYPVWVEIQDASTGRVYLNKLIALTISAPYYKTWWFYGGSLLIVVLAGIGVSKRRETFIRKHEQQQAQLMNELNESKLHALRSQMNPHFLFNAMNSIQAFILKSETKNAVKFLNAFSKLMRSTLDNSSTSTHRLTQELDYLKNYVNIENLRFGNSVKCIWDVDDQLDADQIEIPTMVIQPFIENVYKHAFRKDSKNPEVQISFTKTEKILECKIYDNGKGFEVKERIEPHGISIAKRRMQLIEPNDWGNIEITSQIGNGTTVKIDFPILD